MTQSAYIKLVEGSKQTTLDLAGLKDLLLRYQEMTNKTGQQLDWDYQQAAFPYEIKELAEDGIPYLYLKGTDPHLYYGLLIGVSLEQEGANQFVQIVLPDRATHGDKAKGNEFSRFLAKELGAELHLFNKRIMYFNKRKQR